MSAERERVAQPSREDEPTPGPDARPPRAVVLVDHGSREPEANAQLEAVAARLRVRLPDRQVYAAHMELASPSLEEAIEACVAEGAREVVVHPYFLAPGRHASRDIPRMARAAAARHPHVAIHVTDPLGLHEGIVEAVLARISGDADPSRRR